MRRNKFQRLNACTKTVVRTMVQVIKLQDCSVFIYLFVKLNKLCIQAM